MLVDFDLLWITISILIFIILLLIKARNKRTFIEIFIFAVFYFYIVAVIAVTLFPIPIDDPQNFVGANKQFNPKNNFIPLYSSYKMAMNSHLTLSLILKQIGGNLILFVPLGFYLPFASKNQLNLNKVILAGIVGSVIIEITQQLIGFFIVRWNYRIFDIDDIILNVSGSIVGYLAFKISLPYLRKIYPAINLKYDQLKSHSS